MPLLGGIFHRRDKQNNNLRNVSSNVSKATESVASIASTRQSTDVDYVFPDKPTPQAEGAYEAPAAASPSKLKLPFRRKHAPQTDTRDIPPQPASLRDAPAPSYISGVVSDSGHDLPLPPRKSSLFGIYNDRNMLSTHSLPGEHTKQQSHIDTPSILSHESHSEARNAPPQSSSNLSSKKAGGLFAWARERTKSKPSQPASTLPHPPIPIDESFNLKSFRPVRSPSPTGPAERLVAGPIDDPLPPPRPRPREDSVASDSSQRISVAAFREAQARRSRANSPVPSFRPPSAADMLRTDSNGRKRASTISAVSGSDSPQSARSPAAPTTTTRPNSAFFRSSSESDESESEDDEEVDSDGVPVRRPVRERTITRRTAGGRARSDAGHNSIHETPSQRPDLPRWSRSDTTQTNQSDPPFSARTRASASTSALTPSAAARRASVVATANAALSPPAQYKPASTRQQNDDSDSSSDSSNSDSEDMPLSTLVAPRRPGSSASVATNQSGGRTRMPAKPLIDIKALVGSPPPLKPILRHEDSIKNLGDKGKQRDLSLDEPFTPPPVLSLSGSLGSPVPSPVSPEAPRQSPVVASKEPQPPLSHHRKSSSDAPTIQEPKATGSDDDLLAAIRLVNSFDKEREKSKSPTDRGQTQPPVSAPDSTSAPEVASPITTNDRIIPTPIRERKPPASFSVTSRPPQRTSMAESPQMSATSPLPATLRSPPMETRPRSSTVVNSPPSNEKSDAISVVSTSKSSTSRNSRIPPVPLIDSIPDSPSVKSDYKPGQPPSRPRAIAPSSSHTYPRPPSGTLVSLMPSSGASNPKSLMPHRPFVSNSSVRGESPAGSSTGDSSSGWGVPFTPRDGSEIGVRSPDDGSDVGSTLKPRGHMKKPSVTFEDSQPRGRERVKGEAADEERRRERRRSEARAAIELGKIVNGRGPLVREDSDEDLTTNRGRNPRISMNPMMGTDHGMPMMPQAWGPWPQPMMPTGGMAPQFSNDANLFAAHQHALLIAKQAYQMAVAQHAMALAGEEWERSSNMGGFGSGGSVYGGSGGSVSGGMTSGRGGMNMMGMPGMGMLMPPAMWSTGSVAFPSSASAYGGISSSQSEFGGARGGWGSRSVYGDSFGPSASSRSSFVSANHGTPSSSASAYGGGARPRARTGTTAPSSGLSGQQLRSPGNSPARTRVAPPSSWKSSR